MTGFALCVIGNSHVAALKLAWDRQRPSVGDDFTATFFSAQNRLMKDIVPEGRSLVSGAEGLAEKLRYTSGGLDRIEIDRYDAFVLVASGFGIDVPRLIEECGVTVPWRWGENERIVSHRCLETVIETYLEDSMAITLIEAIRKLSPAPLVIAAPPFVSECVIQEARHDEEHWLEDRDFMDAFVGCARRAAENVAARRGIGIVWQREETVARPGFTREAFNHAPVRFSMRGNKGPEFDPRHGNAQYGAMMLADVLERLDGLTGGRVLAC